MDAARPQESIPRKEMLREIIRNSPSRETAIKNIIIFARSRDNRHTDLNLDYYVKLIDWTYKNKESKGE